jgi:predicted Zn finger-like uncharacterized protein
MILTCPRCATRYVVEDAEVHADGRKVRCSACAEEWRVYPEGVEPPVGTPDAPAELIETHTETHDALEAERPAESEYGFAATKVAEEPESPAPAAPEAEAWPPLIASVENVETAGIETRVDAPEPTVEPWTPAAARVGGPAMVAPISTTGRPSRGGSRSGIVVLVVLLVLAVLLGIFLSARREIVQAVPGAASVYKAIGLPVIPNGG